MLYYSYNRVETRKITYLLTHTHTYINYIIYIYINYIYIIFETHILAINVICNGTSEFFRPTLAYVCVYVMY